VARFVAAGGGFLLAVLWFDLMFDVQALRAPGPGGPEAALTSIAAYYRRVTTDARPMNRLVAAAMVWTLAAAVVQLVRSDAPTWVAVSSLVLAGSAVVLAATRTVPAAVRLGARGGSVDARDHLARTVARDHLACLTAIAALLAIQLGWG
jgi:hypothetical protein